MRKFLAWLGAAAAFVVWSASARASGPTVLKPYIVLILDVSGSMQDATGSGPPSCQDANGNLLPDTKLNHARCAINNIVNTYGDIVFAFARFHEDTTTRTGDGGAQACGTNSTSPTNCHLSQDACTKNSDRFQLLTALDDKHCSVTQVKQCASSADCPVGESCVTSNPTNAAKSATWSDFTCSTCSQTIPFASGTNPETWNAVGSTPIEGSLHGAQCYWEGENASSTSCSATSGTLLWPSTSAGFSPIANDPLKNQFLPAGCDPSPTCTTNCCATQCRPYITVMLTDGDETCGGTQSQCSNSSTTPCFVNSDCPSGGTCQVGTVDTAAHNLLSTVVGGKKYTIKTIPIGFGTGEPYQAIEDLAFAGGTPKVPGQNSGFYAQDEAGLELALSQIIESSVRSETCNNMDDDCDGNVDEDFPCSPTCTGPSCNPACQQCDNGKLGVCKGTGTNQCTADGTGVTCNITNPGGSPQTSCPAGKTCNPDNTETCGDGLDNDCDGFVDEGCTACTPTAEICDGRDNDCDGVIDEDVPARQCGAFPGASCSPNAGCCGTQTCAGPSACPGPNCGKYTACNNTVTPGTEQCNGIDDDCDGVVDEDTTKSCSDITGNGCTTPPCPGTNNPGDPANSPIPQNICHPGTQQCTNGTYGACTGEVTPQTEICNGLDDDCDNIIDEDTGGGSCNATCGVGQILCAGSPAAPTCCQPGSCAPGQHQCGTLYCSATSVTTDATCDGVDDDCDGKVDEDWQCGGANGSSPNVPCSCNGNGICNGQNKCVNGAVVCEGTPIDPSSCCDCMGNPQNGSCSGGAMCASNCQCAYPCSGGEFPCPSGKKCDLSGGPPGLCVNDPCFGVTCGTDPANGDAQVCADQNGTGKCVDACSVTTCQNGLRCYGPTGECLPNDCTSPFPDTQCAANQNCVVDPNTGVGTCVSNPCSGVTCPSDQYCEQGNCIQSCASITCPSGQRCRLGMCETDPCGKPCPFGQVCNDATGQCINDPCQFRNCPRGQYCNPNDGMCEADPCVGTMCPSDPPNQVCKGGTCYNATQFQPDGGAETHVTVGGGGCNSSGGGGGLVLVLGVLLLRRRRTQGGAS